MAKKREGINLLPQEEFEASTLGRVLKWLLGTFRYIVISIEMVVMIAFLSRFWLDARSGDLIDTINQKKLIVASYLKFENQYRTTQEKLKTFTKFADPNQKITPILNEISSRIPGDIILTEISIDKGKLKIVGESQNQLSTNSFINNFDSSNLLTNVSLENAESKAGSLNISFTISAQIKTNAKQ